MSFQLRLPVEAHAKLRVIAKRELRSKNAEIEYIISRYIEQYEREQGELTMEEMEAFLYEEN